MKKRYFLPLLLTSAFFSIETFSCSNKIDQSKAILFLDLNSSYKEVVKAQEAACVRGERLIVLPDGVSGSKKTWPYLKDVSYLREMTDKYDCDNYNSDKNNIRRNQEKCLKYEAKLKVYEKRLEDYIDKKKYQTEKYLNSGLLKKSLKELANSGVAVTALIASGHDGGGEIDGIMGELSKENIIRNLKESYKDKPDLLKQLKSILLWGCYTATPQEVMFWKSRLPQLSLISGFHAAGPLSSRASSGGLMKDLLIKSQRIIEVSEEKKMLKMIEEVKHVLDSFPAIYIKSCDKKELYYYRTDDDDIKHFFGKFKDAVSCSDEIAQIEIDLDEFFDGAIKIPYETKNTNLRRLYSQMRQRNHCFEEEGSYYNPELVGLLLFYHNVKINFSNTFKNEIALAEKELKTLDFKKINRVLFDEIKELESELQKLALSPGENSKGILKNRLALLKSIAGKILKNSEMEKKFNFPTIRNIKDKSRKEILKDINSLRNIIESYGLTYHSVNKKIPHLKKLYDLMDNHLNLLNRECMNFLEWHEVTKKPPESHCR